MASKVIEILINAQDKASSVFANLKTTVAGVGAAIAAYLTVDAFAGVVKGAANFEQAMSKVQAATGATKEEMVALEKAAKDASASSQFSSVETASALENLAKAGLNATEAIGALPPVIQLAEAGGIDLATSSEKLTKIISGMGDKFSDAGRYADVLALGANASNTSVLGLADALSYAAPIAQSLGLKLEPTVAMIGKLADGGIDASRAGTALNGILSQFADPASKFRNELALAGITTNNFEKALHQLADAGPRSEKAILAVGQEAGPALRALLNQGMGALDDLTGRLKNAEGSAAATAEIMRNNLNGALVALGNAWQSVKDALGVPVLPVLKQGVEQLAAAFKAAVADGSVTRFGESIATAFKSAIDFTRDFLSNFSFDEALARLQKFADDANTNLKLVSEYASNSASAVKVAFAVMSTGANAVMTGIYGIAASYTEAAIRIVDFAARASEALSKIAIGDAKERLKREAEEMRATLGGLAAVRDAFLQKTQESLDATTRAAQAARDGFTGISDAVEGATPKVEAASKAFEGLSKSSDLARETTEVLQRAIDAQAASSGKAGKSAEEHGAAMAKLRAEYAELVASGSIQEAAKKLQEINKALADTPPAAKDAAKAAKNAADEVAAAFGRLGIESAAALARQAASAKMDFETIRKDGTSTAEDISAAFGKAAEAAIAANKGVAPSWVTAEAGVRGYRIEVDAAGKSHLELINKAGPGLDRLARGWQVSREAIQAHEDAMDKLLMKYTMTADYTERQIKLLEREAAAAEKAAEAYRKKWNMDKEGYSLNTAGDRINQGETQQQVDEDVSRRYGKDNVNNADAQRARQLAVLLGMIADAGGQIRDPGTSKNIADMRRELQELELKILNTAPAKPEGTASNANGNTAKPNQPDEGTGSRSSRAGMSQGTPVVFNFQNGPPIAVNLQGPDDVTAMAGVVSQLMKAKGTAR